MDPHFDTARLMAPKGPADYYYYYYYLWAAAAAADPSWDSMSGERESHGRLCEHID